MLSSPNASLIIARVSVTLLWDFHKIWCCSFCPIRALHQMSVFHLFYFEWPYTVFSVCSTLLTLLWSLCCMNSTITTPFLPQETQLPGRQMTFV
jgi:hypothetical protein